MRLGPQPGNQNTAAGKRTAALLSAELQKNALGKLRREARCGCEQGRRSVKWQHLKQGARRAGCRSPCEPPRAAHSASPESINRPQRRAVPAEAPLSNAFARSAAVIAEEKGSKDVLNVLDNAKISALTPCESEPPLSPLPLVPPEGLLGRPLESTGRHTGSLTECRVLYLVGEGSSGTSVGKVRDFRVKVGFCLL